MLERIIKIRIEEHMQKNGNGLSKNQYGFIKGRSTIDANESKKHNRGEIEERS